MQLFEDLIIALNIQKIRFLIERIMYIMLKLKIDF
jgi:hypothetical protein